MGRTRFVYASICALLLALMTPTVGAQPTEGTDRSERLVSDGAWHPDAPALDPLHAERDLGTPVDVDAALLASLQDVYTAPGSLPQLEVTVDGRKQALPLQHTDVRASISGFVARVEVTQRYSNPLSEPIEAVYVFPLPENSAVDDMKIRVGDRLIEAEIQRRKEARETYETARREGFTAALLEQERPNIFTQSVANIPPGEEIDVVIRYVQNLTYDAGRYEFVFPMVVGPRFIPGAPTAKTGAARTGLGWSPDTDEVADASRITPPVMGGGRRSGHDIAVEVEIEPGLPVVDFDVPTHAVDAVVADGATVITLSNDDTLPNRDFVLRFRVDKPEPQGVAYVHNGKHGGFFSLVVQPPTIDVDEVVGRREIIFVMDISGSMWGRPLAMAKESAREAIRRLRPVDTFNVVTFAGHTAQAFKSPRPANDGNIKQAFQFIESAKAGGGTYLADAVQKVLDPAVDGERDRIVVFLTDGYVGNEKRIVADVQRFVRAHAKAGHEARAFGFGIGSSVNRYLLDGVGKAGKGASVYLTTREAPLEAVQTMGRLIDHPILTDVEIDWGGLAVADVEPAALPDLLASRPLVIHGRFQEAGEGTIVLRGKRNGKKVSVKIPVVFPENEPRGAVLETLWARARIESLSRKLWDGDDKEVIETITALGLDYRLVTPYTSFVAVDRSRKVGDGDPETIVQPIDSPEGVVPEMAAPAMAIVGNSSTTGAYGSIGLMGVGKGGGGLAGKRTGVMKIETKKARVRIPRSAVTADPSPDLSADGPSGGPSVVQPEREQSAKTRRAVVKAGSATVKGALADAMVRRVARRHLAQLRACFEREVNKDPSLAGKLELSWTIRADGRVGDVSIATDTVKSKPVAACVTAKIKRWRFPKAEAETTVTWRLAFLVK